MIISTILFALFLLVLIVLSIPVRVRVDSRLICNIHWLFIKLHIRSSQGAIKKELSVFNRKTKLFSGKKKAISKEPAKGKPKKSQKKKKKLTREMVMEILKDSIVRKILRVAWRFIKRSVKSVKISFLNWEIGLKDYYLQGIVYGLLHSLPTTEKFRISGNFQEVNKFNVAINISLIRLFGAFAVLLLSFPYINTIRVYRRVYLQKGRA